ncbi:hypothetical protein [Paracoccus marcusii]|uniref:hypothetical protein n=1 Tax=Paracoccus marcusii TaxID=59779 RepID=UPI0035A58AA0
MTQRRSQLTARLGALTMTACLIAAQAGAQGNTGGIPTAQDIWRHLPPLPGQAAAPEPQPAPEAPPAPRPERAAPVEPAPRTPVAVAPPSPPVAAPVPVPVPVAPSPAPMPVPVPVAPSPVPVSPPGAPVFTQPPATTAPVPWNGIPAATPSFGSRTLAQARVVIHYPERGGFERSQEISRLLRALGTAEVETRPVRYAVDRQSIRYFQDADREVSGTIADLIGGGGRATVADFTFFRPTPRDGTIEIWLP